MFRALFGFLITLVVLMVGGLYLAYDTIEPCKALAAERDRRAGVVDKITGTSTEGMSTTECVTGLFDSWWDRVAGD